MSVITEAMYGKYGYSAKDFTRQPAKKTGRKRLTENKTKRNRRRKLHEGFKGAPSWLSKWLSKDAKRTLGKYDKRGSKSDDDFTYEDTFYRLLLDNKLDLGEVEFEYTYIPETNKDINRMKNQKYYTYFVGLPTGQVWVPGVNDNEYYKEKIPNPNKIGQLKKVTLGRLPLDIFEEGPGCVKVKNISNEEKRNQRRDAKDGATALNRWSDRDLAIHRSAGLRIPVDKSGFRLIPLDQKPKYMDKYSKIRSSRLIQSVPKMLEDYYNKINSLKTRMAYILKDSIDIFSGLRPKGELSDQLGSIGSCLQRISQAVNYYNSLKKSVDQELLYIMQRQSEETDPRERNGYVQMAESIIETQKSYIDNCIEDVEEKLDNINVLVD